jgi:hypothetical protein
MTQMHVNAVKEVWGATTRQGLARAGGIKSFAVWRFRFLAASRDAAWLRRAVSPHTNTTKLK